MNANYTAKEVLMAIDDCVKKEFTDVNLARSVAGCRLAVWKMFEAK